MGNKNSKSRSTVNKSGFDDILRTETIDQAKILILGSCQSGKSTLLKQLQFLYDHGFTDSSTWREREIMHYCVVNCAKEIVDEVFERDLNHFIGCQESFDYVKHLAYDAKLDVTETPRHISDVWQDAATLLCVKQQSTTQLQDCTGYFLSQVHRIASPSYSPSIEDVMNLRVRTTGIVQNSISIHGSRCDIFDVGGAINERKKWIHIFDGVSTVIFCCAISEYERPMYENRLINRLDDSVALFTSLISNVYLRDSKFVVLFSKIDVFERQLQKQGKSTVEISEFKQNIINRFLTVCGDRRVNVAEVNLLKSSQVNAVIGSLL